MDLELKAVDGEGQEACNQNSRISIGGNFVTAFCVSPFPRQSGRYVGDETIADASETSIKLGLGGGCHWCTEAVFQTLAGISNVEQGFVRSDPPNHAWSEAVLVTFDPVALPMEVLIEVHLRTHSATSHHKMRGKYRSAVYTYDAGTGVRVSQILHDLQKHFDEPLVTKVLTLSAFRASDERFQNYYLNGPERPFCKTYIDPKLSLLRRDYAANLRKDSEAAE